jgi:translocation and assembly module TamB
MRVEGDVTVGPVVFHVPAKLPTQVTTIPVEERNTPPQLEVTEQSPESRLPVKLEVQCKVPGRFYVLGNGLDSEWEGNLAIKGTVQKPELRGTLRIRRGLFLFLNRRLELKDSTIAFDGSTPISPYFNFWGTTDSRDLTARVHIYGNLNSVELDLESEPPLPEDQVLARLLFNRELNQLSPVQALQLARTAAALSGGGLGLAGVPRGTALPFVDRVKLQTGEDSSETALGFGKYLGERTYVEVQQGIGPENSKVSVELELTPEISVEGEVGADAQSAVGLFWKKDY